MTKKEVAKIIKMISLAYPTKYELSEDDLMMKIELWYKHLCGFKYINAYEVLMKWIQKEEYAPKISNIVIETSRKERDFDLMMLSLTLNKKDVKNVYDKNGQVVGYLYGEQTNREFDWSHCPDRIIKRMTFVEGIENMSREELIPYMNNVISKNAIEYKEE